MSLPMNADPQLAREVVELELAAWLAYWQPDHPSQEHQLYVPGKIVDFRGMLRAIDEGFDYGQPDSHRRLAVCRYWTGERCRRVLSERVSSGRWRNTYARLTQASCDREELRLILWHPLEPDSPACRDASAVGDLGQIGSCGTRRVLWMPWLPHGDSNPIDHPVQLELPLIGP